jgi:hypothetical protein
MGRFGQDHTFRTVLEGLPAAETGATAATMDQGIVDKMGGRKHGRRSAFLASEVNCSGAPFHEASFTID